MYYIQKAYDAVENYFLARTDDKKILIEASGRRESGSALSSQIEHSSESIAAKTWDDWIRAVASATDPDNPEWTNLYRLHENLWLDDHLESVTESRIAHTYSRPIKLIDEKGNESKEITSLFNRPWYQDMVKIGVGHQFRGRRMMEMIELDSNMELKEVEEVKQPWFNTKTGLILKRPGDSTGWNYREGVFADYYIQVGKNYDIGMFSRMAPTILGKKLGMGAWLDFIDKYGVPPLFITTDREDKGRLDQLFAAAKRFKANNFMIGRGQEKFEIPNIGSSNTDAYDRLCTRADNMMSKRMLGGTGLTDEKGFVGSVEIQYKLALNRFNSDGLIFKHLFNTEIKPRLIKLSPVYKPLEKFTLEYDDSETMTQQQKIDAIIKIGEQYDVDPEYITQVTGIPILGKKQVIVPGVSGEKK